MDSLKRMMNYAVAPFRVIADKSQEYCGHLMSEKDKSKKVERIYPIPSYRTQAKVFFQGPTEIIDGIYLGSAFNAASYYKLRQLGVKMVINVTREIRNYYPSDFVYHQYDLFDNNQDRIHQYLDAAYQNITAFRQENPDQKILIHCFMGASRSASILIYYLMKTQKDDDGVYWSFSRAAEFVKNKRKIINPTKRFFADINGFDHDVEELEHEHLGAELYPILEDEQKSEVDDEGEIVDLELTSSS